MRLLPLLVLIGCVTPIGSAEHAANGDTDRDGVAAKDDCDDGDPNVHPGAIEWCNGVDDNCDGQIDGPESLGQTPFWPDADGDNFGDNAPPTWACELPEAHVAVDGDCADNDPNTRPGVTETCNGLDDDCDGEIDEEASLVSYYGDVDGDGFGGVDQQVQACLAPPGWFAVADDCDDTDNTRFPGADERCNGLDDDCDTDIDEDALDAPVWYVDGDSDGFGDVLIGPSCVAPANAAARGGDCDDSADSVHPDAVERCDLGVDNNCNGTADDLDATLTDAPTWFFDDDGDGFGDPTIPAQSCQRPANYQGNALDCDDGTDQVQPGAAEICGDGVDNNCDGLGCSATGPVSIGDGDGVVPGAVSGDGLGASMAWGDLSGDGTADLVIGAAGADAVYVLAGPIGPASGLQGAVAWVLGAGLGDLAVADLDGDGWTDLLIGDPDDNGGSGAVRVFFGPLSGAYDVSMAELSLFGAAGDGLGAQIAVGDFNNDSVTDLLLGAPQAAVGAGEVHLMTAPWIDGSDTSAATITWTGLSPGDALGTAIAGADFTGDGVLDAVFGAPGALGQGQVYALQGPVMAGAVDAVARAVFTSDLPGDAGAVLAIADWTGDGVDDVGICAPSLGADAGAVWVIAGSPWWASGSLSAVASSVITGLPGEGLGRSLGAGDVDGDGVPELFLGGANRVWQWRGPLSPVLSTADAQLQVSGDPGDLTGAAVLGADTNGDGYSELLIGSPGRGAGELTTFLGEAI